MSNLLDKASIILTPTAYNNGEALCVKPSDGSGDFDFSRNSAATRVNAQGLVENVQILSSNLVQNGDFSEEGVQQVSDGSFSQESAELVTNGDFSNGYTGWNIATGWNISNEKLNAISVNSTSSFQNGFSFVGKSFKVTYTISDYSQGEVALYLGGNNQTLNRSENGTFTEYVTVTSGNSNLYIYGTNNFTGSIDNCSVREVGQDWDLIGTATITENQANIVTASAVTGISQSNILTIGKSYKLSYNIVSNNNGGLKISGNEIPSVVGNNIYYFEASAVSLEILRNSGITDISITNISVKEVGQNWEFGDGWSVGSGLASKSSGTASNLFQSNVLVVGLAYKVTFTLSNYSNGNVTPYCGGTGAGTSRASNGTFTEIIIALTSTTFFLVANSTFTGSVTNISVIEITDDTNLPRINYEGFSYQDALGSEEIVNGDFATDSDWNKASNVTIQDSSTIFTLAPSGQQLAQSINPTIGKQYKIVYEIKSITQGAFDVSVGSDVSTSYNNSVGVYTEYLTATSTNAFYIRSRGVTSGSIDNVSVKEYLGQEVVPDSGCGSWLFEPQSTNLITQSEAFNGWILGSNSTLTYESDVVAPDGSLGVYRLTNPRYK